MVKENAMIKGHTIELTPNNKQATYFAKACGVLSLAYNWALADGETDIKLIKYIVITVKKMA